MTTEDIQLDASLDRRLEAHANDALRELWDRVVDQGGGLVTRAMAKEAIDARLADVLGAGVLPPVVTVTMNANRTGFDVTIRPAATEPTIGRVQ